jgi:enoyl-[acyl-carrier protein] reductase I
MTDLMQGKRGLVMGVANDRSIAWGIAKALRAEGAELAFSYQGEAFGKRVEPLAASLGSDILVDMDVTDDASLDAGFEALWQRWARIDVLVHAIAYSDKSELTGRFVDTSRENFKHSIDISCYSFIEVARRAYPNDDSEGGTMLTLTYRGSNRVTPFYNVMGVAKAALEASVRYLANDLGPDGIRVNAISPGPMKTLAGAAIGGARKTFRHTEANAPLRSNATLDAVGGTAVYLASTTAPARPARSSRWIRASTCWGCRRRKTSEFMKLVEMVRYFGPRLTECAQEDLPAYKRRLLEAIAVFGDKDFAQLRDLVDKANDYTAVIEAVDLWRYCGGRRDQDGHPI